LDRRLSQAGFFCVFFKKTTKTGDGGSTHMKKQTYVREGVFLSYAPKFAACFVIATAMIFSLTLVPASALAGTLGTAGEFNTFILGDFGCSSDTEGRLAVGGNAVLDTYSVADKLTTEEQARYEDMLIVGGDLTFTGGRVYYGNILVGGSGDGINEPIASADGEIFASADIPIDFVAEEAYLKALSQELAALAPTGTAKTKWGGLRIVGDGESALQVFDVDGTVLPSLTWVHALKGIPSGATVVFNISGTSSGMSGGWQPLAPIRTKVLFNFYEATTLSLQNIGVEGSILAPFAHVDDPQGVIYGTIIAASWEGPMQQNHFPFEGEGLPEPPSEPDTCTPIAGDLTCGTAVVDGEYAEWDLTADFFAEMHEAGKVDKDHLSNLYLRYDVTAGTMFALVLREGTWEPDAYEDDAWIKIYDLSPSPLVDGNSSDFQWIYEGGTLIGYEASFALMNGEYADLEAHISVDGGKTSSTGKKSSGYISLDVDCPEPTSEEGATITKYQRFDDSDEWVTDPLDGLQVGETLSYLISVENLYYDSNIGFALEDTLSNYVDFNGSWNVEKITASGETVSIAQDRDYVFDYDSDLHQFTLDYFSALEPGETFNFFFDVTANENLGSDMVVTNQANVAFGENSQIQSNIVEAHSAGTTVVLPTPDPTTIVPEPGTLALIGLGLLGIFGLRRKRQKP
jgi:choice-of-anchor A domain-containing protein